MSTTGGPHSPATIVFRTPNKMVNELSITDGEIFLLAGDTSTKGPSASVATTDAPHTYRVEMNTTTGAIEVFRDNVSTLNGAAFVQPAGIPVVRWGDVSGLTSGVVEWTGVKHNAHAFYPCP